MSSPEDHAPPLSETRARQGRWGRPVFWMLAFSLILAVLAMIAVWAWHWGPLTGVQSSAGEPASDVARYASPPQPRPQS